MTLVGHRRLKIAAELGIAPIIQKLVIGIGDEADAKRLRLAIVLNIGHKPMTKEDRQRIAKYLYGEREWTMQRIADALNVGFGTVQRDLADLSTVDKSKPAKTATNPKGSGRHKSRPKPPAQEKRDDGIIRQYDAGRTYDEIAEDLDVPRHTVANTVKAELQQRKGEERAAGQVDPATLSLTAQQKLDAAIAREKKRLQKEFDEAVYSRVGAQVDLTLENIRKRLQDEQNLAQAIIRKRSGFITKKTWNLIRARLHPDTFDQIISLIKDGKFEELEGLKERQATAFRAFKQFEKLYWTKKKVRQTWRHRCRERRRSGLRLRRNGRS